MAPPIDPRRPQLPVPGAPALPGGGGMVLQIGGQPDRSERVEDPHTTTQRREAAPGVVEARAEQLEAHQRMLDAADREQAERDKIAAAEAKAAEDKALLAEQTEKERERIRDEREKDRAARRAETDARRQDLDAKSKITDYWEDKSTPARIVSAFLIGQNECARTARGGGGGPNMAYQ